MAILVEAATDNRNRTAADVRAIFTKAGGQLAGAGAVAWQFEPRGVISVARDGMDADEVALLAIDAGATTWTPRRTRSRCTTAPGRPGDGPRGPRGGGRARSSRRS